VLFGAHCSGGVKRAVDRAEEIGADAVQLFVQSPRAWRFPNHDPAVLEAFRERGMPSVVHAIYLLNLASPQDELYEKSVETLGKTVDTACAIGAEAVVFHVGSHLGAGFEAGVERAVPALEQVLERCGDDTWLLIENSAGAGGTIGRSLEELATLYERLGGHPRLGVCLDSCHLYVSGYDVTDPAALDEVVARVDELIGLDRLRVLHVNDTPSELGSNRDRHANLLEGEIGEGMGVFLAHPAFQELPALLEVPGPDDYGPDAAEVQKLRDLHARARRGSKAAAQKRGKSGSRRAARGTRG
jgi:deoxyribonuclease IV